MNDQLGQVERIDAITLATVNMAESVAFYEALGFVISFGSASESFATLDSGSCFVNLWAVDETARPHVWWGRIIFHVDDVDQIYRKALDAVSARWLNPEMLRGVKGFSPSRTLPVMTSASPSLFGLEITKKIW